MNRVSVVTVCLNARSTIEATLRSVKWQSFPCIETVLIDGGSTDGTLEVIKSYRPDYFVSEPDQGIYDAMNKGVQAATGDIVFFLNSGDTFYDDNVVSDVVLFFNKTGSDAVFGNLFPCYLHRGDTHDHKFFRSQRMLDLSYFNNRKLFYYEPIHHQAIFYKRKIFDQCAFICNDDAAASGEYHLHMCAFVKHGYSLKHFPKPICRFALGGKSTSNFAEEWRRYVLARHILRRKFFPWGPRIPVPEENEYLYERPSFPIQLKIRLRHSSLYPLLLWMKLRCHGIQPS